MSELWRSLKSEAHTLDAEMSGFLGGLHRLEFVPPEVPNIDCLGRGSELRVAMFNLVANALRYSRAEGRSVYPGASGGRAKVFLQSVTTGLELTPSICPGWPSDSIEPTAAIQKMRVVARAWGWLSSSMWRIVTAVNCKSTVCSDTGLNSVLFCLLTASSCTDNGCHLREVAGSSPRLDGLMARHGFCDCAQNDGISFVATARRMTVGG